MSESKFIKFTQRESLEPMEVCGIPFLVKRNDKDVVENLEGLGPNAPLILPCDASCEALFFLGMATEDVHCSEWWGQSEPYYDHSRRVFIGDRLMRIAVVYDDHTEDLISVIFGVNCWNYHLYYRPKDKEQIFCADAPYDEPFSTDPAAAALKDASLHLMENTGEDAEKCTKWVFGFKTNGKKKIKSLRFSKEDAKRANVAVSAVTGLAAGEEIQPEWDLLDLDFFLRKDYYAAADAMARRLYQYRDELPASVEKIEIPEYDAPDITFSGNGPADIFTNVYRKNIMDMAHDKIDDEGHSHTSSKVAPNFGCYLGLGTFNSKVSAYGTQIWTRDVGRTMMEVINNGYGYRVVPCAEDLHQYLYYPAERFPIPHWKRIANLVDDSLQGNENDGHAAIMLGIYSLYRKGDVDLTWLTDHKKELKDAAEYFLWQADHPDRSNFRDILFSASEASTQANGGYDLFSNTISAYALVAYSRLFKVMGEEAYALKLEEMARQLREGIDKHFLMNHPRYGKVYTDTTDDCWTYEYKRMADCLLYSDVYGYDMADKNPELFDRLSRTFLAQKEQYYAPNSGRQMGYGQGYLTQSVLMLDRYEEFTDCVEEAAVMCYHHTDFSYIVPEGVIMHGSKRFWFRNSDLGNGVQQAEIVKCVRLLLGIDDISYEEGVHLVPRLPLTWKKLAVTGYSVTKQDRSKGTMEFTYERTTDSAVTGKVEAMDGTCRYVANWETDALVTSLRVGPFDSAKISVKGGKEVSVKEIQGRYFAYVTF